MLREGLGVRRRVRVLSQIPSSDRPLAGYGVWAVLTSIKWVPAAYPRSIISLASREHCKGGGTLMLQMEKLSLRGAK